MGQKSGGQCLKAGRKANSKTHTRWKYHFPKRVIRRIQRHIAHHPRDLQAPGDLERIRMEFLK